jgi:hypothetical protein
MASHSLHNESSHFCYNATFDYGSLFSNDATLTEAGDTHFIRDKPLLHYGQLAVPPLPDMACSASHWLRAGRPINVWG